MRFGSAAVLGFLAGIFRRGRIGAGESQRAVDADPAVFIGPSDGAFVVLSLQQLEVAGEGLVLVQFGGKREPRR